MQMNANCRGVPLRWMAREALTEGKYSQASDVFAFGVCLWEIYTYAREFGFERTLMNLRESGKTNAIRLNY